jgi:hypothetical protein
MVTTGGAAGSSASAAYFASSASSNFDSGGGGSLANYRLGSGPVSATPTIIQWTSGTAGIYEPVYFGESFTTPSGGPWNNITFNFYSTPAGGPATPASTPLAAGTAFLLTAEYLGTPAALSSSTPGYLAQSTSISGGLYIFPSSLVLSPGTKYWIYENAPMTASGGGTGGGSAGAGYFAQTATSNFDPGDGGQVVNYNLSGGSMSVAPAPPTFLLTVAGLLCVGLYLTRRRIVQQA